MSLPATASFPHFFPLPTHPLILLTQGTPNSTGSILPQLEKTPGTGRKGAVPSGKEGRAPFLIFEQRAWSHRNPRARSCDKPHVQQLFDQDISPNKEGRSSGCQQRTGFWFEIFTNFLLPQVREKFTEVHFSVKKSSPRDNLEF